MVRDARHVDLPGGQLDEEQHGERAKGDRLGREEVACQDAGGLGAQERPPVRVRSPGGWPEARAPEDRPDGGGPDADPELSKLALDSNASPPTVLPSQPEDQGADLWVDRGPAGLAPSLVGPLPPNQLPVPPEQGLRPHEEQAPALTGDRSAGR